VRPGRVDKVFRRLVAAGLLTAGNAGELLDAHRAGSRATYDALVDADVAQRRVRAVVTGGAGDARQSALVTALAAHQAPGAVAGLAPGLYKFAKLRRLTPPRADARGLWERVEVAPLPKPMMAEMEQARLRLGHPRPPVSPERLVLRREPIHLEMPAVGCARATPGTYAAMFLPAVRALAIRMGWSEADAARYLVEGTVPKLQPVVVRVIEHPTRAPGARSISIMAREGATAQTVAREFARAVQQRGRPLAARTIDWVAYADAERKKAGHGSRPDWQGTTEKFATRYPQHAPFSSVQDAATCYRRATAPKGRRRAR
jgi:hypothetical protein